MTSYSEAADLVSSRDSASILVVAKHIPAHSAAL
jgi:hypothetical protein